MGQKETVTGLLLVCRAIGILLLLIHYFLSMSSDQNAAADLHDREVRFNEGLQNLMKECKMGLHARAIITEDGRVGAILSLIPDNPEAREAAKKAQEPQVVQEAPPVVEAGE